MLVILIPYPSSKERKTTITNVSAIHEDSGFWRIFKGTKVIQYSKMEFTNIEVYQD